LVIRALKRLRKKDAEALLSILNAHTKDAEKIREAIGLLEKAGAVDYARKTARKMMEKSWSRVDPVLEDCAAKQNLKDLAEYVISRPI
ncbi:MAG TPA: hypothetical protein VI874_04385, partial [Candidatus Norongarragalinales archaeon]|nr:hypothetical protein [Candidatus Norongarragalinales archaeon]